MNVDFDNFVIIDDIEYAGTMCAEALNPLDLGENFYTTPMLSVLRDHPIHSVGVENLAPLGHKMATNSICFQGLNM